MRNLLHNLNGVKASSIWKMPRRILCLLIHGYQQTFSPDHGPLKHLYPYGYCRHHPTCSEYGKQVLTERGVVIGSILLTKRILSCNPWKKPTDKKLLNIITKSSQE